MIQIKNGLILVDGMPIGRIDNGKIVIRDRDKRRSDARGSDKVEFSIDALAAALAQYQKDKKQA